MPPEIPLDEAFEDSAKSVPSDSQFMLDLDGYEGPIDVLLTLAREQKVDLTKIKIVPLVDQYLAFISTARTRWVEASFGTRGTAMASREVFGAMLKPLISVKYCLTPSRLKNSTATFRWSRASEVWLTMYNRALLRSPVA